MQLKIDPFAIRKHPKWHWRRLIFTFYSRLQELQSRGTYLKCALPPLTWSAQVPTPRYHTQDTAVTPEQMGYLLGAINRTESLSSSVIVEVGSFRGVTTRCMASSTARRVVAVDPYRGYGGCEEDEAAFRANTRGLANVVHLRETSGTAARHWNLGAIGMVFVDAVHDYVNTSFDCAIWSALLLPDGILALHDTDNPDYAGTRRVAFETARTFRLVAHVDNLVLFQKA